MPSKQREVTRCYDGLCQGAQLVGQRIQGVLRVTDAIRTLCNQLLQRIPKRPNSHQCQGRGPQYDHFRGRSKVQKPILGGSTVDPRRNARHRRHGQQLQSLRRGRLGAEGKRKGEDRRNRGAGQTKSWQADSKILFQVPDCQRAGHRQA